MRGFVLAAGFGTRLRPLTDHIPKALVPVCGKPLLARSLAFLRGHGVTEIAVNSHYLADKIENFRREQKEGFSLYYEEGDIRGTGGALYFAREFLSSDEAFAVINADIVCDIDLRRIASQFLNSSASCALIAFPAENGRGTILYNRESGAYLGTPGEQERDALTGDADFIGAALYRKGFLKILMPDDFSIVPVWKRAVKMGMEVQVMIQESGWWRDTGTPDSLAEIHFAVLDKKIEVEIGEELRIDYERKNCYPASLYECLSGNPGSYAWVESLNTGANCRICRSVVLRDTPVDNDSVICDSILTPWGAIGLNGKN